MLTEVCEAGAHFRCPGHVRVRAENLSGTTKPCGCGCHEPKHVLEVPSDEVAE